MARHEGFVDKLIWLQRKLDFTPQLIKLSDAAADAGHVNVVMFVIFLLIGFLGLFLPLVQGWLVIFLAFTFLGIKPLNDWIQDNHDFVEGLGAVIFTVTTVLFVGNFALWGVGIVEENPLQNALDIIQWGQDDLEHANEIVFSVVGLEYTDVQQSLSVVDYTKGQGLSIAGISEE